MGRMEKGVRKGGEGWRGMCVKGRGRGEGVCVRGTKGGVCDRERCRVSVWEGEIES